MKKIKSSLLLIFIASYAAGWTIFFLIPDKKVDEKIYLGEVAPDTLFSEKKPVPPHYISDTGIVAFNSYDITPSIKGYAGPIKLLIALSPDGRIHGIKILEHSETRNYVHYMESRKYLSGFLGKSIFDRFEIDQDIDAVSRATVSVKALAATIRDSSRKVASNLFGIDAGQSESPEAESLDWIIYMLFFSASFTFYVISRRYGRLHRARDIFLAFGIPLIGFYISGFFSLVHIFNLALFMPSSSGLWYAIVISTVISVIAAGRFYCGWICPFGALSEFIGRLPFRKWQIPASTEARWRNLKYFLLGLTALIVFLSMRPGLGIFETYITLFSMHGSLPAWILVIITLAANIRIERFWCRFLCPVAALTGILSRKDSGYVSGPVCPMSNSPGPHISECIRCNRCYLPAEEQKKGRK